MQIKFTGTYTDLYQIAMGQAYFLNGYHQKSAVFDYFFRKIPFDGGYVVFAGLDILLEALEEFRFTYEEIEYLRSQGYREEYLEYLKDFEFRGSIYGCREGEIVFPTEPILRIEGNLLETQLVETMLLNILNFQSLIATKAARIRSVAPKKIISEFGLRRAQGAGGLFASRAAVIGGADSTSNVLAGKMYGIPISGTMAHSFVQIFDDELTAFQTFARANPDACVLLVDTYNTLKSGVPNAIKVAKEMEKRGQRLLGIRLDSGDLSYFARKSRKMLDDAGLQYVKIAASNQLDEYVVRSLLQQNAPIDIFGVGTNLAIGKPQGALDGVYKLVMADNMARIKVSENIQKTTLPGRKQVYRLIAEDGSFYGADAIGLEDQEYPHKIIAPYDAHKSMQIENISYEPLFQPLIKNGEVVHERKDLDSIKKYAATRLALLPPEYKRFENPHGYKVGISPDIKQTRDELFQKYSGKKMS